MAAIGTDGIRPVVWGVGHSRDEALVDAGRSFAQSDLNSGTEPLVVKAITEQQHRRILDGEVSTEELGIELDAGDIRELTGDR